LQALPPFISGALLRPPVERALPDLAVWSWRAAAEWAAAASTCALQTLGQLSIIQLGEALF
jgi:hypothetical protein